MAKNPFKIKMPKAPRIPKVSYVKPTITSAGKVRSGHFRGLGLGRRKKAA
jgi:hypothetical protein